jgi:hypothetical protein
MAIGTNRGEVKRCGAAIFIRFRSAMERFGFRNSIYFGFLKSIYHVADCIAPFYPRTTLWYGIAAIDWMGFRSRWAGHDWSAK